jgi:hypothetical protein
MLSRAKMKQYNLLEKNEDEMRNNKPILLTSFLFVIGLLVLQAQETIPAAGGNCSGTGGTLSYTAGQIVFTTNLGTNGSSAQGVQQSFEISVVSGTEESRDISLDFVVYPNPSTEFIELKVENYSADDLVYELYNLNGTLLEYNKITDKVTRIVLGNYNAATYFLLVTDKNQVVKTFKIIKN